MAQSKLVLVTGATGKQGGACVEALLTRGHQVRALTRNSASPAANRLRERGVEITDIAGDELTGDQAAAILSKVTGREIRYEGFPPEVLRAQSEDMARMFGWFDSTGYAAAAASGIKASVDSMPSYRAQMRLAIRIVGQGYSP
jgi:uncharacterized protein YbjT (DUF2867 family)